MKSDKKIIADYLRFTTNNDMGGLADEEYIEEFGGEDKNEIIKNLGDNKYVYHSSTSTPDGTMHWITVINTKDYSLSATLEV